MSLTLTDRTEIRIKFNEADPLGIVWHGHYIRYFEDGRESFGEKYGLTYLDCYKQGYVVPIVSVNCSYKKSLEYGDRIIVETRYLDCQAAKLNFEYKIYKFHTEELVATGSSTQVFLEKEYSSLCLVMPPFFEAWKKKWLLL